MGIRATAKQDLQAIFDAFKAASTPNRTQRRKCMAAIVEFGQAYLADFDAQDNAAPAGFAASRQAQFNTYLDGLAEPQLPAVNPAD